MPKAQRPSTAQPPGNYANLTETRVLDLQTNTPSVFTNKSCDKDVQWLGKANQVVWLKEVAFGATEIWIAESPKATSKCVDMHLEIGHKLVKNPQAVSEAVKTGQEADRYSAHCAGKDFRKGLPSQSQATIQ